MGMLRIQVREIEQQNDNKYIGYTIMFLVMVLYTCIFCWTYIKRVIYLAFLTMIAPMVALTYPIDKANDGKHKDSIIGLKNIFLTYYYSQCI